MINDGMILVVWTMMLSNPLMTVVAMMVSLSDDG